MTILFKMQKALWFTAAMAVLMPFGGTAAEDESTTPTIMNETRPTTATTPIRPLAVSALPTTVSALLKADDVPTTWILGVMRGFLSNPDVKLTNAQAQALFCMAAWAGDEQTLDLLIKRGARIDAPDGDFGQTALHQCALVGEAAACARLLDRGAAIDPISGRSGTTPLYDAVMLEETEVVALLIDRGADVNHPDVIFGFGPLHAAVMNGYTELTRMLIEAGADINAPNHTGVRALHIAATMEHRDLVELLVEHGGDINAQTDAGRTPLDTAIARRAGPMRELIERLGGRRGSDPQANAK